MTQVVGAVEGHIFHNRLTHTLEVAQIARRLAEKLAEEEPELAAELDGIDPDITEAAALAHDLGHPPFGHVAEEELDALARTNGARDGFEGNAQSFRIVAKLSAHRDSYKGLNLCRATLNAILKYPWFRQPKSKDKKRFKKYGAYRSEARDFQFARVGARHRRGQSIEAAIMDVADAIAYSVHDLEDFYRAGLVPLERLLHSESEFRTFVDRWVKGGKVSRAEVKTSEPALHNLLEAIITDEAYRGTFGQRAALRTTSSNLIKDFVYAVTLRRPRRADDQPLCVHSARRIEIRFLQALVWQYVISNPRLATQQHGQRQAIRSLFAIYFAATRRRDENFVPPLFHDELRELGRKHRGITSDEVRLAIDTVAALTDSRAEAMYRRVLGVSVGSVTDIVES